MTKRPAKASLPECSLGVPINEMIDLGCSPDSNNWHAEPQSSSRICFAALPFFTSDPFLAPRVVEAPYLGLCESVRRAISTLASLNAWKEVLLLQIFARSSPGFGPQDLWSILRHA